MLENKERLVAHEPRQRNVGAPHPDARRHALRLLGRDIDAALARLRSNGDGGAGDDAAIASVETAWRAFGALLDLGPDPDVARCPSCGATGMANATRCGHCWAPLDPPA
ncbi:MAG: hypothetical protein K8M05_18680 [Deltaproteobacteria bacterium]|nr:hypothetical protein [Kofleriaceae bacterium]